MNLRVVALLALLCVSSAVSAKKYTMPTPVGANLPVDVVLHQQEIAIDVPDNSAVAGQFGLIGAIVGAAINNAQVSAAEKRAADIRNLLVDFNFNQKMEAAIRAKIASEGISSSPELVFLPSPWDFYNARSNAALKAAADAGAEPRTGLVMNIAPRYALAYTLQSMYVRLSVSLVDRQRKANGKYKEKYLWGRNYSFTFPLESGNGIKAETNAKRWATIGSAEMARMMELGVDQVTDMMVYDFSPEGRAEGAKKVKKEFGQFKDVKTFGRQIRTSDDWYWVRSGKGYFESIAGIYPLKGALPPNMQEAAGAAAPTIDAAPAPTTSATPAQ